MNIVKKILAGVGYIIGFLILGILLIILSPKIGLMWALAIESIVVTVGALLILKRAKVEKESADKFKNGLFAILLLVWGSVGVGYGFTWLFLGEDKPTQQVAEVKEETTYSDTEVYIEARFILENFLRAPSTAKYPSSSHATIQRLKDNGFKVSSYVDSQNGFGAMIRSNWTVLFQYVENEKIKLYQVVIDGEEMYRADDLE